MDLPSQIQALLQRETPHLLSSQYANYASVALLCRGTHIENLEIGYILRAVRNEDRWSGQIGFPGGRAEDFDSDEIATAIRETREEVGIHLAPGDLLGRLDDIQSRQQNVLLDFYISPLVFWTTPDSLKNLKLNPDEVADFFWISFSDLTHPERQTTLAHAYGAGKIELPAIQLPKSRKLWGLSYLITQNLIHRLQEENKQ